MVDALSLKASRQACQDGRDVWRTVDVLVVSRTIERRQHMTSIAASYAQTVTCGPSRWCMVLLLVFCIVTLLGNSCRKRVIVVCMRGVLQCFASFATMHHSCPNILAQTLAPCQVVASIISRSSSHPGART